MATKFDPYHEWLGIPPAEQPATHYRLLGLKPFENDPSAVQSAAERQLVHVKTFQLGKQKLECQKLLNELTAAKLVLLDPNRRGAYDVVLRSAAPASALEAVGQWPAPEAAPRPNPIAPSRPIPIGGQAAGSFAPGGTLAKYRILEMLAGSLHARTHKVQHLETGRYYFLKFVPPSRWAISRWSNALSASARY